MRESGAEAASRFDVYKNFMKAPVDRKALYLVLLAMIGLALFRTYDFWTTGFLVSDEHEYITEALTGNIYGARYFYGYFNIIIFHAFGVTDINSFFYVFPFDLAFWGLITLFVFYKILKLLNFSPVTIAASLVSSLFLISFMLLSAGFLTEPAGLAMAMLGIYFLLLFAKNHRSWSDYVKYPLLSTLCFSAARYTREPYTIFLIGCIPVIAILAFNSGGLRVPGSRRKGVVLLAVAVLCFAIPAGIFLQWPTSILGQTNQAAVGLGETITSPVVTNTTTVYSVSTTSFTTTTLTTTTSFGTSVSCSNQTAGPPTSCSTVTVSSTGVSTETTTVASESTTSQVQQSVLLNSALFNTAFIFFGGIFLGWGPVLFLLGASGILILLARNRRLKERLGFPVAAMVLLALGSYLVVSYIFSNQPAYLSVSHYSTIIRFSDTALPAYFLAAPFAISAIERNRRVLFGLFAILLVFTLALIPTYEAYAASNLSLPVNPFSTGYRTPGVDLRDYVSSHSSDAPFTVMGFPQGMAAFDSLFWAPGGDLKSVTIFPYLNETAFVQEHWTTFYLYYYSTGDIQSQAPYLYSFVNQTAPSNSSLSFSLANQQVVFHDSSGGTLLLMQLNWSH